MMNFETRTGPPIAEPAPVYPSNAVPEWYRDAKLGFFVHWGLYSVPAWAVTDQKTNIPVEDAYAWHKYAEWYGNTVRIMDSPTRTRHESTYGVGTSYEDLADLWKAESFNADSLVGALADAGARYVIPTTKHHEGFCLWNSATTRFSAAHRGPKRDLIREIHDATRSRDLRFGVYFSGALDWHVSEFQPIESDTDLFRFRRNDNAFARYSAAQLEELVEEFSPEILWNDIDWPDGGKGHDEFAVAALLRRYFDRQPNGVVNDRWGVPYHGFLTREYSHVEHISATPWEATRGLGLSFGYNQDEGPEQSLSGAELIRLLVDVVSKNGNLLINVGPRADGTIPDVQRESMSQLGAWLRDHGASIYGTRPWTRPGDNDGGSRVSYTTDADSVYIHVTDTHAGEFRFPRELDSSRAQWLTGGNVDVERDRGFIPEGLRGSPVAVCRSPKDRP